MAIFWLFLPTFVPFYFWSESLEIALALNVFRHLLSVHQTSLVNSAAHLSGEQVYDKRIDSRYHRFTTYVCLGEAYHNFHHVFPWHYSTDEFGFRYNWNPMTACIDFCAWLGLAWDLKVVSNRIIEERIIKYGDIKQIETKSRKPSMGVIWDYLQGFVTLFWALWIILACRCVYLLTCWSCFPVIFFSKLILFHGCLFIFGCHFNIILH